MNDSRSPLLLGIDVGTTGVRVALVDPVRRGIAFDVSTPCAHVAPQPGWAEADPELWWRAVVDGVRELGRRTNLGRVLAVGVVGQAPTAVLVDAEGRTLGPAILWLDTRAAREAEDAARILGVDPGSAFGGNRIHPYFLGPKLLWLERNEPERMRQTARVLQSHEFVASRLAGMAACVTEPSTAALVAPLFDLPARSWSRYAMSALGIDADRFGPLAASDGVIGHVTDDVARATGLVQGTPVVAGGGDFAAATLAAGVIDAGQACLMLGTAGNLLMPLAGRDAASFDPRLINSHHVGVDRALSLGGTLCGGALEWFRRVAAPDVPYERLDAEAAHRESDVIFFPYLQGERTPLWDVNVRGVFHGLSLEHDRGTLWHAVLRGVAMSLRHSAEVAAERGLGIAQVTATNGAGKSGLFRQILADVLGVPLEWSEDAGGTVLGAAWLAGLGVSAVTLEALAPEGETKIRHEPDRARHERANQLFARRRLLLEEGVASADGARRELGDRRGPPR